MAKQRLGVIISLEARLKRRAEEQLCEANRRMVEAEHALFVALRLAGHRGVETPTLRTRTRKPTPLAAVVQLRPRRKRAAA
jgi:hypothetical protein